MTILTSLIFTNRRKVSTISTALALVVFVVLLSSSTVTMLRPYLTTTDTGGHSEYDKPISPNRNEEKVASEVDVNLRSDIDALTAREGIESLGKPFEMSKAVLAKRRIDLQPQLYEFGQDSKPLKVKYPILVLNLPKTGTTTLWKYFECGLGVGRVVHWWTTSKRARRIGPCVEANIAIGEPPLKQCGKFDVWIDFGYASESECFFPAVHGYKALYEAYPQATFLLVPRNVDEWLKSAEGWHGMLKRWKRACRKSFFPDIPVGQVVSEDDIKAFYLGSIENIRQFAQDHPDMNLIMPPAHITLSSPELGNWLEETFGIEARCWGKCQPQGHNAKCEAEQS